MPRNRSGALAALGSSVRRTAPPSYSTRVRPPRSSPLARRIVVGAVALASFVLITIYFRESDAGALHEAQSVGASVLRPFEVGADRLARPFRDAYGYASGLFDAKAENTRLRQQVKELRNQAIQNSTASRRVERLGALLRFRDSPSFPHDYTSVAATVMTQATSRFDQQVVVSVGRSDGVRRYAPVVTDDGLVGHVSKVARDTALVTLLTDKESAVAAYDFNTESYGIVRHGEGAGNSLVLDRVPKEEVVRVGDLVVTSGRRFRLLPSIYPRDIAVGTVTSVGQSDIDVDQQIQVKPLVDFSSLDVVLVLVPKERAARLP
jgi:rod shape-determining protein MreC